MRRSLLFIPSNSPSMLQNADIFSADSIIFDLEDAVAITEKDAARTLLEQYLNTFDLSNIEIIIRINDMDSIYSQNDIGQIVSDHIDTIMLPKASASKIDLLSKHLDMVEQEKKLSKKINIIPIIELASSLLELKEIASFPRVNGLLLGAEDLTTDIEVPRTEDGIEILYARSMVVVHAKAFRIDAIDTPFTNTKDEEGLIKDSKFAASLGMNAKACIHPNQIEVVNQAFSPSAKEIQYAKKVLAAYEDALKLGKGAFSVDGKMVDKPIIERAKILIKKAEKWGV
jgi:citrate lyase subunit beta / citryl-CoA lyase